MGTGCWVLGAGCWELAAYLAGTEDMDQRHVRES